MSNLNAATLIRRGGILSLLILSVSLPCRALAQEPGRTVEEIFQFDERGDAKVEYHFQLDRGSWEYWKAEYGDHPDLMLRSTKHDMAAAVIEDFALDKDDTHRSAITRFKARALAQYRGNGQFEIAVPKNMKLVTGSGLEWVFTNSASERMPGGGARIVNMTYRGKLPAKASDARLVSGNDFDRLIYSLQVSPTKPKALLYSGVFFVVAAIALAMFSLRAGRRDVPPRLPPLNQTPSALPPP
jgi:hypothetical protein